MNKLGVNLSLKEISFLNMIDVGLRTRGIAHTLSLSVDDCLKIYAVLLEKAKVNNEIELSIWWRNNRKKYEPSVILKQNVNKAQLI